jgi:hypothetical protein
LFFYFYISAERVLSASGISVAPPRRSLRGTSGQQPTPADDDTSAQPIPASTTQHHRAGGPNETKDEGNENDKDEAPNQDQQPENEETQQDEDSNEHAEQHDKQHDKQHDEQQDDQQAPPANASTNIATRQRDARANTANTTPHQRVAPANVNTSTTATRQHAAPSMRTVTGKPNTNVDSQVNADMNSQGALMLFMPCHSQDNGILTVKVISTSGW